MKITKSQLRKIIKEESSRVLNEQNNDDWWVDEMRRVLEEMDRLYKAVASRNPDDLELFEDFLQKNVSMNYPWMILRDSSYWER